MAPSFTNILNVYAFCNLHDVSIDWFRIVICILMNGVQVSWGTKGSDKMDALPSISSSKTADAVAVVEDTARDQSDLDAVFKETVQRAVMPLELDERKEKPTLDDQNKTFRTRLVAAWMLSNAAVAVAVQNLDGLVKPVTRDDLHSVAQLCDTPTRDLETCLAEELLGQQAKLANRQAYYFSFILYGTFFLSLVRFIGVSAHSNFKLHEN
jgi:chitin synthase